MLVVQPERARARGARVDRAASAEPAEVVALTREHGKNDELRALLGRACRCARSSCRASRTRAPPTRARLPDVLRAGGADWDWVLCTSPEAAAVLVGAWEAAARPALALAAVGKATCAALRRAGLDVAFTPSKATGKTPRPSCRRAAGRGRRERGGRGPRAVPGLGARGRHGRQRAHGARLRVTRLDAHTVPAAWPAGATPTRRARAS